MARTVIQARPKERSIAMLETSSIHHKSEHDLLLLEAHTTNSQVRMIQNFLFVATVAVAFDYSIEVSISIVNCRVVQMKGTAAALQMIHGSTRFSRKLCKSGPSIFAVHTVARRVKAVVRKRSQRLLARLRFNFRLLLANFGVSKVSTPSRNNGPRSGFWASLGSLKAEKNGRCEQTRKRSTGERPQIVSDHLKGISGHAIVAGK